MVHLPSIKNVFPLVTNLRLDITVLNQISEFLPLGQDQSEALFQDRFLPLKGDNPPEIFIVSDP